MPDNQSDIRWQRLSRNLDWNHWTHLMETPPLQLLVNEFLTLSDQANHECRPAAADGYYSDALSVVRRSYRLAIEQIEQVTPQRDNTESWCSISEINENDEVTITSTTTRASASASLSLDSMRYAARMMTDNEYRSASYKRQFLGLWNQPPVDSPPLHKVTLVFNSKWFKEPIRKRHSFTEDELKALGVELEAS